MHQEQGEPNKIIEKAAGEDMRCERYFYSDHGRTLWVKCKSPSNLGVLWERISVSFIIFLIWCVKKTLSGLISMLWFL